MRIICQDTHHFILKLFDGTVAGELYYEIIPYSGTIKTEHSLRIKQDGIGSWQSSMLRNEKEKIVAEIKIRPGGLITLSYNLGKKKYNLRSAGIYKNRFILCNSQQEEMLALLPAINWAGRGYEYVVQVNEEFENECNPLLVLHAIHCANCYLGILNGTVPALINI